MSDRSKTVNPTVDLVRGSIELDRQPPSRRDLLRECEACMWLVLDHAQRGVPLSTPDLHRFMTAQQNARQFLAQPKGRRP